MSFESMGSGLYGQQSASGAPIGLSPATLRAEILSPVIRMLLSQSANPPDTATSTGLLNWARSFGQGGRSIIPTIPTLPVTQQVRQLLQLPSLAAIARSAGGPPVNPDAPVNSGQFPQTPTSGGTVAPAPTSQQSPSSSSPSTFIQQIVDRAVASVLSESAGNASDGGNAGGPGPDPGAGGGTQGGGSSGGGGGGGGVAEGSP